MVQLLGALASDAEYMPSLLHALRVELLPKPNDGVWGSGYYQEDRALVIHKPAELVSNKIFSQITRTVHSRSILAARAVKTGAISESPPFRFRHFLFGATGDLDAIEPLRSIIVPALPKFIATELGDASPAELVLSMFMRELHDQGYRGISRIPGAAFAGAVKKSCEILKNLCAEASIESPFASYMVTDGRVLVVSQQGPGLVCMTQTGLENLPDGPPDQSLTHFNQIVEAMGRFRAVLFASQDMKTHTAGWEEVGDGNTIWVDQKLAISPA